MILPDILHLKLDVVFCGTAAGDRSAVRGAYYAGPGNQFYATLFACGLTSRLLLPHEFKELPNHKIGLTDLGKEVHGMDSVLKRDDFDVATFELKILEYQPKNSSALTEKKRPPCISNAPIQPPFSTACKKNYRPL
jgi:double-stranded uracil-DNA glycosylase